jgi:hypothetical protein
MKPHIAAALGVLSLAVAAPALAQPPGWDIDRREQWLADRIDRAVANGSLDRREAHRVHDELRGIHHEEDHMRMRHDGRLSDEDRGVLENRLDNLSHQIHWLRENNERAPWWR